MAYGTPEIDQLEGCPQKTDTCGVAIPEMRKNPLLCPSVRAKWMSSSCKGRRQLNPPLNIERWAKCNFKLEGAATQKWMRQVVHCGSVSLQVSPRNSGKQVRQINSPIDMCSRHFPKNTCSQRTWLDIRKSPSVSLPERIIEKIR